MIDMADSENKLDYGPSPGAGLPRTDNIQAWADQANPNYQASGGNLKANPRFNPTNADMVTDPNDAYTPTEEALPTEAEDIIQAPSQVRKAVTKDFMRELVVNRGIPFGEAVNIIEELHATGDPTVSNFSDIDEFIAKAPSKLSRVGQSFMHGIIEGPAALADRFVEATGRTPNPDGPTYENRLKAQEMLPGGPGTGLAWAAGVLGPSIGVTSLASNLATKGLLRLPNFRAASQMVNAVASRAKYGKVISSAMLNGPAALQLSKANMVGNIIGGAAVGAAYQYGQQGELQDYAIDAGLNVVGGYALGKLAGKGLGPFRESLVWASRKSGVPVNQLAQRVKTFDQLLQLMNDTDMPQVLQARVLNGLPGSAWRTELGTHFGLNAAIVKKVEPEILDGYLEQIPLIGRAAAKRAYYKAYDTIQKNAADIVQTEKTALRIAVKTAPKSHWSAPTIKVPVAIGEGLDNNGGKIYFAPGSKFAKEASALGPVATKTKVLIRPLEIAFDPDKETLAQAVIKRIKGVPSAARATMYVLNRYAGYASKVTNRYDAIADTLAYRLAKKSGYESIVGKAINGRENRYVDLLQYTGEQDLNVIVDKIEGTIQRNYTDQFEGIVSIIPPIIGAGAIGAGVLLNPTEADAINFNALRKAIGHSITADTSELATMALEGSEKNARGAHWAVMFARRMNPDITSAKTLINKMEEVHGVVRSDLSAIKLTNVNVLSRPEAGARQLSFLIEHPGVVNATMEEKSKHVIGQFSGWIDDRSGELGDISFDAYGPELLGLGGMKKLINLGKGLNLGVSGWRSLLRVTGARPEYNAPASVGKFGVPIIIGLGVAGYGGQAEAKLIDIKQLGGIAEKVTAKLFGAKTASMVPPVELFLEEVEAQSPATSRLLWGLYEKQAETAYVSKDKLLADYSTVVGDLRKNPGNITTIIQEDLPGRLNYAVAHPLSARSIANIGGYVDPVDKKWFLDVVGAKRVGVGVGVLQKIVDNARDGRHISGIKGKYSKLAMIAAATGATIAYDWIAPKESQAVNWGRLMSKGFKGLADETASAMASANSADEILAAMRASRANVVKNVEETDFASKAEALFGAADGAPGKAFDTGFKQVIGQQNLNTLAHFGRPTAAINHPYYDMWFTQWLDKKDKLLIGTHSVASQTKKIGTDILDKHKILKPDYDELVVAMEGLRRAPNGSLAQTVAGIRPHVGKAAVEIREQIMDDIWKLLTGIHAKAPAILKHFGLEESESTYKLLQWLQQQDLSQLKGKWRGVNITPSQVAAAEQTRGMINPQPWQSMDTEFVDGYLTQMPIKGERAKLLDETRRLTEMYPNGGAPPAITQALTGIKTRLARLGQLERELATRKTSNLHILPKGHFYGPISEAREVGGNGLPEFTREKDPGKILGKYIDGALSKAFFDEQLYHTRGLTTYFESVDDPKSAEFVRTMVNTFRGIRSMNEDTTAAYVLNKFKLSSADDHRTVQTVRNIASNVMQWNYFTKLAIMVRYPLVNLTQTAMTTAPVVGWSNVLAATGKILGNPKGAFAEAGVEHVLRAESLFAEEIGHSVQGNFKKGLDYLPGKAENLNRVIAYHAAKNQVFKAFAKKGSFTPQPYVRNFDASIIKTGNVEKIAREYARAVVRTTQFIFGPEGKPMIFNGGAIRRVAGQFKSFQVGYMGLINDMAKAKDAKALLSATTSLYMLGGLKSIVGAGAALTVLDYLRLGASKLGFDPDLIPESSLIGSALAYAGFSPDLDVSSSITASVPIFGANPITEPGAAMNFALGPTFGGAVSSLKSGFDAAAGKIAPVRAGADVVRQIFPLAITGAEALQEAGIGEDFFDALNYRGGIYSNSGALLVKDRPLTSIIARGLNVQPSVRSQRAAYLTKIERAYDNNDLLRVRELTREARAKGFVINKQAFGSLKSRGTKKKSEVMPNQSR